MARGPGHPGFEDLLLQQPDQFAVLGMAGDQGLTVPELLIAGEAPGTKSSTVLLLSPVCSL